MNILLKELLQDLPAVKITGETDPNILSLSLDSRKVLPGSLFIAIPGQKDDGIYYIEEAIDRGAVAVMVCKPYNGPANVSIIQVKDIRSAMAKVARRFYNYPDESLHLVGVTGTNGKTTVATLSQFLLNEDNYRVGMLGTVRYDLGKRSLPATKTTPESLDTQSMLNQMLQDNCKAAVMEVSSHGIALKRIQSMPFDITVFLNLTQDHLDFHGDMETYFQEKSQFFTGGTDYIPKTAIVNIDDPYGLRLLKEIPAEVCVITFGTSTNATVQAFDINLSDKGISFNLQWPGGIIRVESALLGAYNVSNILAALSIGWASGREMHELVLKLPNFKGVRGRMEKLDLGQDFSVLVDYAHTADALSNALKMLRSITSGRLLVVFGCGGNRDRAKRPLMTAAVQEWADFAWATADNPRGEDLESIFNDMRIGVTHPEKIHFVSERRRAIDRALEEARERDCVLIAGKGHETYQAIGTAVIPFDDYQIAKELLIFKNKINVCV